MPHMMSGQLLLPAVSVQSWTLTSLHLLEERPAVVPCWDPQAAGFSCTHVVVLVFHCEDSEPPPDVGEAVMFFWSNLKSSFQFGHERERLNHPTLLTDFLSNL